MSSSKQSPAALSAHARRKAILPIDSEKSSGVQADELRTVLCELLPPRGFESPIFHIAQKPSPCSSSYPLQELTIHFEDDCCLELFFKDVNPASLSPEARRAKPAFLDNPCREIELYRSFLAAWASGAAGYYGSVVDVQAQRFWLFLEKVQGAELYQFGDLDVWNSVARWLAEFHSGSSELAITSSQDLIRYDAPYLERWMQRGLDFIARRHDDYGSNDLARLQEVAVSYPQLVAEFLELPVTLIHGEFYASNILVREGSAPVRICPIDWERAAIGPGLVDLAALTAGKWTEQQKIDLAASYFEAVPSAGTVFGSYQQFLRAFNLCRLHVAVQWLGWSDDWSPPSEHKQDWLAEAEFALAAIESHS